MPLGENYYFDEGFLPMGYDFGGDGNTNWGTPSPDDNLKLQTSDGYMVTEEEPGSPEIDSAEHVTVSKNFICSWEDAKLWQELFTRGTVVEDSQGYLIRILSCKITRQKSTNAKVNVIGEIVNSNLPPDEYEINPTTLNVDIIKHPRYFFALNPNSTDAENFITVGEIDVPLSDIKQQIIRAIQTYREAPFYPNGNNFNGAFQNNIFQQLQSEFVNVNVPVAGFDPNTKEDFPKGIWDGMIDTMPSGNYRYLTVSVDTSNENIQMAVAAAMEIVSKIWLGIDTPYVAGLQITWRQYSFTPQMINPGGYVENPFDDGYNADGLGHAVPVATPELPVYFWSSSWPPDPNNTVFDDLPWFNPTGYSSDGTRNGLWQMTWLRQADTQRFDRVLWVHTRTWIGSPIGNWDPQIYGAWNRPTSPSDYVTTIFN